MDVATILKILDAGAQTLKAGVALYAEVKDAMSETDQADIRAKLATIAAENDAMTVVVEAKLEAAAQQG